MVKRVMVSSKQALTEDHAAFISGGVSITASSRDNRLIPSISRVLACSVSADRSQIRIFLVRSQSLQLLRDLSQSRMLAAVFSLPSSHRTLQIKGADAEQTEVLAEDFAIVEKVTAAFADDLCLLGYSREFARAFQAYTRDDLVAIHFSPCALFEQSPGPDAGKALELAL
ncbi:MAG TPA: hypothetical protein VN030_08420 [Cellvibrio sp.]|nr:hypothetical protein [Cellvibrio sp.]